MSSNHHIMSLVMPTALFNSYTNNLVTTEKMLLRAGLDRNLWELRNMFGKNITFFVIHSGISGEDMLYEIKA